MGTRSTIALEFADGRVGSVYCHWDGYLSNNGKILINHYSNPFKMQQMIDLGNISSLKSEIGEKHQFDGPTFMSEGYDEYQAKYGHMTKFYGRDRDEDGNDAQYFENFEDYVQNNDGQEYDYILRNDGVWYVDQGDGYEPLIEAFIECLRQEHEASME